MRSSVLSVSRQRRWVRYSVMRTPMCMCWLLRACSRTCLSSIPNGDQTDDPCVRLTFLHTNLSGEGSVGKRSSWWNSDSIRTKHDKCTKTCILSWQEGTRKNISPFLFGQSYDKELGWSFKSGSNEYLLVTQKFRISIIFGDRFENPRSPLAKLRWFGPRN